MYESRRQHEEPITVYYRIAQTIKTQLHKTNLNKKDSESERVSEVTLTEWLRYVINILVSH